MFILHNPLVLNLKGDANTLTRNKFIQDKTIVEYRFIVPSRKADMYIGCLLEGYE